MRTVRQNRHSQSMTRTAFDWDEDKQRPVKQSCCEFLRQDGHWKCLVLTCLIYTCIGVIIWCRLAEVTKMIVNFSSFPITTTRQMSPCDDGYIYIPMVFVVMLYLVYLIECWHCNVRIELNNKVDATTVYDRVRKMREASPIIWWKCICYHYVRRTRQVTRYRNGDAYTTTQVYYDRNNTHASGSSFVYTHCGMKDISKNLVDIEKFATTRIQLTKAFAFANMESTQEFEEQRSRFFQEHERYDDYMEIREGLDLNCVHFKDYMVVSGDPERLPWYSSHLVFWVASFVLMSWPIRVLMECNTAHIHYQITKLFGVNYTTPGSQHNNALDGHDIEQTIRSNTYDLVPSYSEALLMEGVDRQKDTSYISYEMPLSESHDQGVDQSTPNTPCLAPGTQRRLSWNLFFTRSNSQRSSSNVKRCHIIPSTSRLSLQAGLLYCYSSPQDDRVLSEFQNGKIKATVDKEPPEYEDALQCSKLNFTAFLRRSLTDKEIFRSHHSNTERLMNPDDDEPSSETFL